MEKFKAFVKKHKTALVVTAVIGGIVYIAIRRARKEKDPNEPVDQWIMFTRQLLPGEDPVEVAKSIMGPDTIVETSRNIFGKFTDFISPSNSLFRGTLIG